MAMLQQDMIAVKVDGDDFGLAFVTSPSASDPVLTETAAMIMRTYADRELILHPAVLSGSSCCSDHQSYTEAGYPSVGTLEPRGYTGDPMYHKAGDLVERADYSTKQLAMVGQAVLSVAASLADMIQV